MEHLALSGEFPEDLVYNGHVEFGYTVFHATGTKADVIQFLRDVSASLADLPMDRLESEIRVLCTEAESRRPGIAESLYGLRFGPKGPGLVGYPEFGLHSLDEDRIRDWASRMFTAGNCALVLSGSPPKNLALELPDGDRMPWAAAEPLDQALPTYIHENSQLIGLSFLAPRAAATMLIPGLLEKRLHARLRKEMGVTYQVGGQSEPIADDVRQVSLFVDAHVDHIAEAASAVTDVLEEFAEKGPTGRELAVLVDRFEKAFHPPASAVELADWAARDELSNRKLRPFDAILDELRALTGRKVGRVLESCLDSSIWTFPTGTSVPTWRFKPLANWSLHEVKGKKLRPTPTPEQQKAFTLSTPSKERMIVGAEGVTWRRSRQERITVRFDACAAVAAWGNGDRVLYGEDGFVLALVASRWHGATRIARVVDAHIAPEKLVPMRDVSPVVQPKRSLIRSSLLGVLAGIMWLFTLSGLALTFAPEEPGNLAFGVGMTVFSVFLAVGLTWVLVQRHRERRRTKKLEESS